MIIRFTAASGWLLLPLVDQLVSSLTFLFHLCYTRVARLEQQPNPIYLHTGGMTD